jgi:hypothetical protein
MGISDYAACVAGHCPQPTSRTKNVEDVEDFVHNPKRRNAIGGITAQSGTALGTGAKPQWEQRHRPANWSQSTLIRNSDPASSPIRLRGGP